jgi:glycosyltransferase involved in cell wall biosynthesis
MTHQLVFFPDYRAANPYQTLLYRHAARDLHPRAGTIGDALALQDQQAARDRVIFHLHWEDAVYRNEPDETAAWQAAQHFLADLESFLDRGGHLVWTLHNEVPHDRRRLELHRALSEKLGRLAEIVHVHSLAAAAYARAQLGIDAGRLALIHHGSYAPLYPRLGGRVADSRAALGLAEARRVLLLFGRLGSYKGGFELLTAFGEIDDPGLWLVVAGRQIDTLAPALAALPPSVRRRVVVEDRFIPHEEVPRLFHVADAVVMPYRASLTSGTALLALSLARPVIAPAFPSLCELLADGVDGLLYRPDSGHALRGALRRFLDLGDAPLRAMQSAARAKAELHDWRQSALLLDGVYARLLTSLRPQRSAAGVAGEPPAPMPDMRAVAFEPPRVKTADAA